jgi:hypothetical protein
MQRTFKAAFCLLLVVTLLALGGCLAAGGDVTRPIPTTFHAAPQTARKLVVMLPGRGDSLADLEKRHVAQLIQKQWPDADVILTGLTMPFYLQGHAPQRLQQEVIAPALARKPRQLWLAGISLGGMGALLYDLAYPGQAHGLLLLSPYLGDAPIHAEIRKAGGLKHWNPGPPQPLGPKTFQRELWRHVQHMGQDHERTQTTWLAYGASDRFRKPDTLMASILPTDHVLMLPGSHDWRLWRSALPKLLQTVTRQTSPALSDAGTRSSVPCEGCSPSVRTVPWRARCQTPHAGTAYSHAQDCHWTASPPDVARVPGH